jgi:Fe-S cluster assembly ATP-binding protein
MLQIKNIFCKVDEKEILKGLNLNINSGEVHAIMGPNGTGKSTLSHLLAGKKGYVATSGEILFEGNNLLEQTIDERAKAGLFLGFQYPVEIPGVSCMNFLKSAVNAIRKSLGKNELDSLEFLKKVRQEARKLHLDDSMLKRSVNQGFSGGEKKRFEVLQMALLEPKLAILDETDSGLDIDSLKNIAEEINLMRSKERSFLIITHYQRLLDHIRPDVIHILNNGRIIASGGFEMAEKLESEGYKAFGIDKNGESN